MSDFMHERNTIRENLQKYIPANRIGRIMPYQAHVVIGTRLTCEPPCILSLRTPQTLRAGRSLHIKHRKNMNI